MPPILHIVRHGQGFHSVLPEGHTLRDPELTPHGVEQCHALREKFPYHDKIELLLASPMRRTLQTASLSFAPVLSRGLHVIAVPSAQEATDELSDVGSEVDVLRVWCEEHTKQVDLGFVTEGWEKKVGENACDVETLRARARKLREWIRGRKEAHVVLVSHGRFAHFMNGTVNDEGEQTDPWWIETEFRSFNFREDEGATIKETEESAEKRKQGDADAIQ